MLKKYYLGRFFWVPIPVKRYQHTSGFASYIVLYEATSQNGNFFVEILSKFLSKQLCQYENVMLIEDFNC